MVATTFRELLVGSGWLSSCSCSLRAFGVFGDNCDSGVQRGAKFSDCPFRPAPVIAPSTPQSPRASILPTGQQPALTFQHTAVDTGAFCSLHCD